MNNKELREKVIGQVSDGKSRIKMYGGIDINTLTKEEWLKKLEASEGNCYHCGKYVGLENLTIDHLEQLAIGGAHNIENVVPSCANCNYRKKKDKRMPPKKKYTQRSSFVHDTQTSEAIMDIISYLEKQAPGSRANASDAIRFAILTEAIDIRQEANSSASK